jgi:hypothetical protein
MQDADFDELVFIALFIKLGLYLSQDYGDWYKIFQLPGGGNSISQG